MNWLFICFHCAFSDQTMSSVKQERGRKKVYQCLRCLHTKGKMYVEAKYRMYNHFLKKHLYLDDAPYLCTLDAKRGLTWTIMLRRFQDMLLCLRKRIYLTAEPCWWPTKLHTPSQTKTACLWQTRSPLPTGGLGKHSVFHPPFLSLWWMIFCHRPRLKYLLRMFSHNHCPAKCFMFLFLCHCNSFYLQFQCQCHYHLLQLLCLCQHHLHHHHLCFIHQLCLYQHPFLPQLWIFLTSCKR